MMGIDDVLLASTASASTTTRSSVANTSSLAASISGTASITIWRSAMSPMSIVYRSRSSAISMASASSLADRTPRDSDVSMRLRPDALNSSFDSATSTSNPARAHTSAIPEPMSPHPTTPTRSIVLSMASPCHRLEPAVDLHTVVCDFTAGSALAALGAALGGSLDVHGDVLDLEVLLDADVAALPPDA